MELDALDRKPFVPQSHDHAALGLGGDFETTGKAFALDDQRVVARAGERILEAPVDAAAVVADRRGLAVHQTLRADHAAAENLADRLVTEADAENRNAAGKARDRFASDAG